MIPSLAPWQWYLLSIIVAWAVQIALDGTAVRGPAKLEPQVFYIAVAIIWPGVLAVVCVLLMNAWLNESWPVFARFARPKWLTARRRLRDAWRVLLQRLRMAR